MEPQWPAMAHTPESEHSRGSSPEWLLSYQAENIVKSDVLSTYAGNSPFNRQEQSDSTAGSEQLLLSLFEVESNITKTGDGEPQFSAGCGKLAKLQYTPNTDLVDMPPFELGMAALTSLGPE